jgi:hypothetical protein
MIIEENGKLYNIDEATGLVTLAATEEAGLEDAPEVTLPFEFTGGERVEADGHSGQVVAVTSSMYGDAVAVRHDSGQVVEYAVGDVKLANVDWHITSSSNPFASIQEMMVAYEEMPTYTVKEIDEKIKMATQLKAAAGVFVRESGATSETALVDQMAFRLASDLKDLEEARMHTSVGDDYVGNQPRYRLAENFSAPAPNMGMTGKGDASWLELEDGDGFSETTDADIAARAVETVAHFERHELENDEFVEDAVQFQASYLGLTSGEDRAKLAKFVEQARQDELAKPQAEKKEAAAEENLDDFDATSLFI